MFSLVRKQDTSNALALAEAQDMEKVKTLERAFNETRGMNDSLEKLIALGKLEKSVSDLDAQIRKDAVERNTPVFEAQVKKGKIISGSALAVGIGAALTVAFLPVSVLTVTGFFIAGLSCLGASEYAFQKTVRARQKLDSYERLDYAPVDAASHLRCTISTAKNDLIKQIDMATLIKFPERENVLAHFPTLKERFAEYATQEALKSTPPQLPAPEGATLRDGYKYAKLGGKK